MQLIEIKDGHKLSSCLPPLEVGGTASSAAQNVSSGAVPLCCASHSVDTEGASTEGGTGEIL